MQGPRIVVLAGGVGGARFLLGVRRLARDRWPDGAGGTTAAITAVVNTGDDLWLAGLRVTPDLDSVMYALAGVNDAVRGWGRAGETERVSAELTAYGVGWPWFTLGDLDLGTHIARSAMLQEGLPLTQVVARLSARWDLGVTLVPPTDDPVETHVVTDEGTMHFEEWWVRTRAAAPARAFLQHGIELAGPSPAALEAIRDAEVILVAPSNPVVSIGTIVAIPGIDWALEAATAPVVGLSPVIGGAVLRGMADACLTAIGVETDAGAIARHYGARGASGLLDGWLVDEQDAHVVPGLEAAGIRAAAVPLRMTDDAATARMVDAALALAAR